MWQCPFCKQWFTFSANTLNPRYAGRYTEKLSYSHMEICESPHAKGWQMWERTFKYL